jgi:hypothetical protein
MPWPPYVRHEPLAARDAKYKQRSLCVQQGLPDYSEGLGEADPEADADASADAEAEADADGDADGSTDPDAGTEGTGIGVGSGMNRDGMPSAESARMRTNAAITTMIHGLASRSSRGGSAPR